MEDLLNKLIEVDRNARAQIAQAKEASAKAIEEFDRKKQKLKEENESKFTALLEQERKKQQAALEEVEKSIEETRSRLLERLDELYQANADRWVGEIVKNATQI